ncbi:SH3 domain-containing protein [Corallincola spongiicola]|uniref:SH3b domain-containing protein n=1 Tax=Corallincola spongiicola TaxID=2520508 RepID=A0ABY1WT51_9GAMM|nr:SH3 domain-containing protein [Corallincola spongiicola]TAA47914.1 hypothetical protein EXY25_01325 [Corallincola spongiicola]
MDKELTSVFECVDRILNPHRRWQEQIDRILEPQRRLQKQMEKYLEPQRRLQEQMKKVLEPQLRLQEQMEKVLEPQRRLQEQMNKYLEPQRRIQEQMERYLEPQRRLQEQMEKYLEPYRGVQEQLKKIREPQRLLHEQINKYLNPLGDYLSSPLMERIAVGSDGVVSVSDEIVEIQEIKDSVEKITKGYSSTEEFLEQLFKILEKLSDGARTLVIYLILPYFLAIIANLTTPIYEEWWKEYADYDQREAKKEIIREARDLYSTEELFEYRFVYASTLNVRELGTTKSNIVGVLHLGKAVKVINKAKNWSFVEYQDSLTGEVKAGWVFSRYLHKFEK